MTNPKMFERMKRELFSEADEVLGNSMVELETVYDYLEQAYVMGVFEMRDALMKRYPEMLSDQLFHHASIVLDISEVSKELTEGYGEGEC